MSLTNLNAVVVAFVNKKEVRFFPFCGFFTIPLIELQICR